MSLEGELTRLRALEAEDVDLLYVWENDPAVWGVSGTLAPFSRHTLRRFLDEQRFDLYAARQLRLVVETLDGRLPVRGRPSAGRRHRHPDPRRRRPWTRVRIGCAGRTLPLCTAGARPASTVVQRGARQRRQSRPLPPCGIRRVRPQAGMAPHARRLGRRTAAAKNLLIYLLKPRSPKVRAARYGFLRRRIRTAESGVR